MRFTAKIPAGSWHRCRRSCRKSALVLACYVFSFSLDALAQDGVSENAVGVVLNTCVTALPDGLRSFFEAQRDCLWSLSVGKECRVGDETLVANYKSRAHYIMLDIGAEETSEGARVAAARAFPTEARQARKLFKRMNVKGGTLPWALLASQRKLVGSMKKADAGEVLLAAASVIRLCASAAMPFNTTVDRDGTEGGKFLLELPKDVAADYSTPSRRCQRMILDRLTPRLLYESRLSPDRVTAVKDPAVAIRSLLLESHLAVYELRRADREVLRQIGAFDSKGVAPNWDDYAVAMMARTDSLWEQRLESGALLAAKLLLTAWENGGSPQLEVSLDTKETEKAPVAAADEAGGYVASRRSTVFHKPNCPHVKRIHQKNRTGFGTFKEAAGTGRTPCRSCKPEGP